MKRNKTFEGIFCELFVSIIACYPFKYKYKVKFQEQINEDYINIFNIKKYKANKQNRISLIKNAFDLGLQILL